MQIVEIIFQHMYMKRDIVLLVLTNGIIMLSLIQHIKTKYHFTFT